MGAFLIWLLATAAVFAGLVFWRESNLHRRLKLTDIHWKAAILLAALIALVPAFLFDQYSQDEVDVPPGVAERDSVLVTSPDKDE